MTQSTVQRFLVLLILFGAVLAGCQTKTSTSDDPTLSDDSETTDGSVDESTNSAASALLKTIVGTQDEGIIRGIAFGDPVGKVRAAESQAAEPFEMFEDSVQHVGYTFETDQLETIDVLYHFAPSGRVVNKITVDVYLNSEQATRQLWRATKKRFTAQYGTPLEEQATPHHLEKGPRSGSDGRSVRRQGLRPENGVYADG